MKVILPMLRALGYEDSDFNYERRTGRGYVDVVVEHLPTGIWKRIETQIQELEVELTTIVGPETPGAVSSIKPIPVNITRFPAIPHILRMLRKRDAYSRMQAVDRKWLDDQLIHKVDGVKTHQAVSFALIELRKAGHIGYEGDPIRKVWLKRKGSAI